jgi:hypothetical protein
MLDHQEQVAEPAVTIAAGATATGAHPALADAVTDADAAAVQPVEGMHLQMSVAGRRHLIRAMLDHQEQVNGNVNWTTLTENFNASLPTANIPLMDARRVTLRA